MKLEKLSGPKLIALIGKRYEIRCVLLDDTIEAGLGRYTHSMMRELAFTSSAPLSGLAKRWLIANDDWLEAVVELEARKRYHGGNKPIKRTVYA
jgi:hypothetical protein